MMTTFAKLAREFAAEAADQRRQLQRESRGYIAAREVEVLGLTCNGERHGSGEPVFLSLSKLSGEKVKAAAKELLAKGATHVAVEVGFDEWPSFPAYMKRDEDYEPRVDHVSIEIPAPLLAEVK